MQSEQKLELEDKIKEKIEAIKEDIANYTMLTKPVCPDNAIGRITRMEAINSKSINEAALNKAKNTLFKLERALAQLDNPDFGICKACGEPIPAARLIILPESDLCVPCAEEITP
ncbi:MAG: TraR/DksA C4-type zinc finger protein [Desulfobacteraceae bacterium]|jgi:DnaK suppressor protein